MLSSRSLHDPTGDKVRTDDPIVIVASEIKESTGCLEGVGEFFKKFPPGSHLVMERTCGWEVTRGVKKSDPGRIWAPSSIDFQ